MSVCVSVCLSVCLSVLYLAYLQNGESSHSTTEFKLPICEHARSVLFITSDVDMNKILLTISESLNIRLLVYSL